MSRSFKKNPGFFDRNTFMKRQANKRVRRLPIDCESLGNGKNYRKHLCSYDICDWKYLAPKTFDEHLNQCRKDWSIPQQFRHLDFSQMPKDVQQHVLYCWHQMRRK